MSIENPTRGTESERSREIKEAMSKVWEAQSQLNQASGRLYDTSGVDDIRNRIISLSEQVGAIYQELNNKEQE